ncbi:NlpC/P60 family protein [Streptomyces sodiiphilus]|uniref:NlpC/P60 family protein n=1 Tax=Streptomyces sodiiphilus TaxID=226217 RepID=A0ABN2NWK8_9ACTN
MPVLPRRPLVRLGTVVLAVVLLLPAAPQAAADPEYPERGAPSGGPAELRALYEQAGAAAEASRAAERRLRREEERVERLSARLARTRTELASHQETVGRLAREHYRQGATGLPSSLALFLGDDPSGALRHRAVLRRAAAHEARTLKALERGERRAVRLARQARQALDSRQTLAEEREEQLALARSRTAEAEELQALLGAEEDEEARALSPDRPGEGAAGPDGPSDPGGSGGTAGLPAAPGAPGAGLTGAEGRRPGARPPSVRGARAVDWALGQIGKPYVWGAQGPDSFDCSGLTSQAWSHARRPIPRTSQQQWARLPRVPLSALRPGDLVVYFRGATHVGLYTGRGQVVHAPRPGARVKVSPLTANPVLGAVRPDAGDRPLAHYAPPPLPAGAGGGDDSGYDYAAAPGP